MCGMRVGRAVQHRAVSHVLLGGLCQAAQEAGCPVCVGLGGMDGLGDRCGTVCAIACNPAGISECP